MSKTITALCQLRRKLTQQRSLAVVFRFRGCGLQELVGFETAGRAGDSGENTVGSAGTNKGVLSLLGI
jgi:hypothetical protein